MNGSRRITLCIICGREIARAITMSHCPVLISFWEPITPANNTYYFFGIEK